MAAATFQFLTASDKRASIRKIRRPVYYTPRGAVQILANNAESTLKTRCHDSYSPQLPRAHLDDRATNRRARPIRLGVAGVASVRCVVRYAYNRTAPIRRRCEHIVESHGFGK